MKCAIVLSGSCEDAATASAWAAAAARRARMTPETCKALSARIAEAYHAACEALCAREGGRAKLMLSLDFSRGAPLFELITDGEHARGAVSGAAGLGAAGRRRAGMLDGLTCVSLSA